MTAPLPASDKESQIQADGLAMSKSITRWHVIRMKHLLPRCRQWYAILYSEAYRQYWGLPARLQPDRKDN